MKDLSLLVIMVGVCGMVHSLPQFLPSVRAPPPTVEELDVAKYLGQWKQMYANILVNQTFERDQVCVTAEYGAINETFVSVYNAGRMFEPDGDLDDIYGYAEIPDLSEPGKLLVVLDGGSPGAATYWIVSLGPESFGPDNLYQYAIITNENGLSLFVLARDPEIFYQEYDDEVLEFLEQNGFNTPITEPLPTYQGPDCVYT